MRGAVPVLQPVSPRESVNEFRDAGRPVDGQDLTTSQ